MRQTHQDLALRLSEATDRKIEYVDVAPEGMRQSLQGMGMPPWQAEGFLEDYAHYSRGEAAAVSGDIEEVTGQPPRSVTEFAIEYAREFR